MDQERRVVRGWKSSVQTSVLCFLHKIHFVFWEITTHLKPNVSAPAASALTLSWAVFLFFFFKRCMVGRKQSSGWWASRDLPRLSADRASWRCCSEGNSTIIHQQAWDGDGDGGGSGVNAHGYARKQLLSTNLTAYIKIQLLKQNTSTARWFFGFFLLPHTPPFKLNFLCHFFLSYFSFFFFFNSKSNSVWVWDVNVCVCLCSRVCVSEPAWEAQGQRNRHQNIKEKYGSCSAQKCSGSSCPSGFLFQPCHWKSHYGSNYVHNGLSWWMTESADR